MRAYLNYFKLRIITNLQYRAAALAGIGTQLFFGLTYIMLYIALYESNSGINPPMSMQSLITYLWMQQTFFALMYPFVRDQELLGMIRNGNLAYELVRPQNFYFKFYIKMLSERLVACLLRFSPILILAFLLPAPYRMSLPYSLESFILFLLGLLMSALLLNALSLLIHIITMFTLEGEGIMSVYNTTAEVFMGLIIPIPFFPKFMITIGKFLPFRFISDFPYRVYSGDISVTEGRVLLLGSIIWLIIIMIIGYLVSKLALKKAVIQGG